MADHPPIAGQRDQRLLAISREGFWELDARAQQFWRSDRLLALMGLPASTPAYASLASVESQVHRQDLLSWRQALARTLRGEGPLSLDLRMHVHPRQWRWLRLYAALATPEASADADADADGALVLSGTVRDIHDEKLAQDALAAHRRELETLVAERTVGLESALSLAEQRRREAEAANAAKSHFLAHMSHEIRTPLTGVLGLTELALRTSLTGQQRRFLQSAHESGQTLLHVISNVLDLSRIESGQVSLRSEPFDPCRTMAHALRSVMPLNPDQRLSMLFDWEGEPLQVLGDAGALRQIATNLLANALKFTPQGQVTLTGRMAARAHGRARLQVQVADTGPGIAPSQRAQVFEPFVQGDASLSRGHSGTGLGLAIARRLAQAMNATLDLHCPRSGGTVFTLTVDLPQVPPSEAITVPAALPERPLGEAWLLYPPRAGDWVAGRLARLGWATRVLPDTDTAITALQALPPGAPRPALLLVGQTALPHLGSLRPLQLAFAGVPLRLMVNPPWHDTVLEAEAQALGIPVLVAPYTPDQLVRLHTDQPDHEPAPGPVEVPAPSARPRGQPAEVLLVEDNPVNQLVIQEFLRALGLRVRVVGKGTEALAACQERSPQLVLLDLELPDMDGLQTARALRALAEQGAWSGAPILALTAHATAADREACLAAGMQDMITKPLSLASLRRRLSRWVLLADQSAPA